MITYDLNKLSVSDVNRSLRDHNSTEEVIVVNPGAQHLLGVGLEGGPNITIRGNVGYYCGGLSYDARLLIEGSAGWYLADNFEGGLLIVEGNAGTGIVPGMVSGTVVVRGNIGSRAGQVMKGGTLLAFGNAGFMTGFTMMGGRIVICGNVGGMLGHYMFAGEIFVGGEVESLGRDCRESDMTQSDQAEIQSLLSSHGAPDNITFRKFICGGEELREKESVY